MNDQLTPINKDHLKKLIRAELELTWFDNKSKATRMLGINRGSFSKKLNQITSNELGLVESL
ncbi:MULTISPECIES: hypothetical protein [Vibrio]|uniref:hypothetical protein n=1 Tax=Vibrio TaxID=662 RepID=UPI00035D0D8C|nr:hypothetical protein [Vibrio splendidus]OEE54115.1 hypothetical protein A146_13525 [Vibrio splendidus FF-500]PTO71813.1 hypothetical protein CWN84_22755 [Vibrio splendidus]